MSGVEKPWQGHLAVLAAAASSADLTLQAVCLGRGLSGAWVPGTGIGLLLLSGPPAVGTLALKMRRKKDCLTTGTEI